VKKKVRTKYSETYDFEAISNMLGMEKTSFAAQEEEKPTGILNMYSFTETNKKNGLTLIPLQDFEH
jgi:hypothetical protein